MDEQRQAVQLEPTYSSSVPIRDVALRIDREAWLERVRNIRADSATWWWWWWRGRGGGGGFDHIWGSVNSSPSGIGCNGYKEVRPEAELYHWMQFIALRTILSFSQILAVCWRCSQRILSPHRGFLRSIVSWNILDRKWNSSLRFPFSCFWPSAHRRLHTSKFSRTREKCHIDFFLDSWILRKIHNVFFSELTTRCHVCFFRKDVVVTPDLVE